LTIALKSSICTQPAKPPHDFFSVKRLMRIMAGLVIILCYIQYYFVFKLHLGIASQFDDLIIIVLFFLVCLTKIRAGDFKFQRNHLNVILSFFTVLFIYSSIFNHVPLYIALLSYKNYFIYFIFYYCLIYIGIHNDDFIQRIIRLSKWIFILQLPLFAVQIYYAVINGVFSDDATMGTFASANDVSYSVLPLLIYCWYQYLYQKNRNTRPILNLLLLVLIILVLIIPKGDFAIVYFIAIAIILLFPKFKNKKILLRVFIGTFIIIPIFILGNNLGRNESARTIQNIIDPRYWIDIIMRQQFEVYSGSTRILYYPLTYNSLENYCKFPLIGFGPGMYASFLADKLKTPPQEAFVTDAFHQLEYGLDDDCDSQIIPIWGELGYVGLSFLLLLFLISIAFFYKQNKIATIPQAKAYAITSFYGSIYLFIGLYVNHMIEGQTIILSLIIFWAAFYVEQNKRQQHTGFILSSGNIVKNENITYQ